jgi:hypothetical protein
MMNKVRLLSKVHHSSLAGITKIMFVNYSWQTNDLTDDLENIGLNQTGLITCGQKTSSGAPDTDANKYIKGAIIANKNSGIIYVNTGSTATPVWSPLDSTATDPLTDGQIFVGNASNVATDVAMTGDVAIDNTGVTTVVGAAGDFAVVGNLSVSATSAISNASTELVPFITIATTPQALSGPGAVNVTSYQTRFTSTGTGNALTLADGVQVGQLKKISYIAEGAGGDTGVLTPTNPFGFATITFNAIGDYAVLFWAGSVWIAIDYVGVTLA